MEKAQVSGQGRASVQDGGTTAGQDELAHRLGEVARSLEAEDDTDVMLDMVVAAAIRLIPGVDEGSISVVVGRRDVISQSPSSDLPRQVDSLQSEVGQGPCLDAVFEQQTVRVSDMAQEPRWPEFARRAAEAGAGSMLSFQLFVEGDNLGALNLYARTPHAFGEESEDVGLVFAAHAAVAVSAAQQEENLRMALGSRDIIGQAKGILMERYRLSADQAFALLVQASSRTNRKLVDIAEELSTTGTAPVADARREA